MWKPKSTGSGKGDKYTISSKLITDPRFDWSFKNVGGKGGNMKTPIQFIKSPVITMPLGERGLFGGGYAGVATNKNTIDYITISTTGNANDFGDLTVARFTLGSSSSGSKSVFSGGGEDPTFNDIEIVTIASLGNATDFGDLTRSSGYISAFSSDVQGFHAGGLTSTNVIDKITFETKGNAVDVGDLMVARYSCYATSDGTTGYVYGGNITSNIEKITMSNGGNTTLWGNLDGNRNLGASVGNKSRGVLMGGQSYEASIVYIDYAVTGVVNNFGTLNPSKSSNAGCSNGTRGVSGGYSYYTGYPESNSIEYITIATTGNAVDFGDFSTGRGLLSASSGN